MITDINSKLLEEAITSGYANLENNKQLVNNLNVFPVPDGDTGTNMALTIQYAVKEIQQNPSKTVSETMTHASAGALMGARGNSGVILSQLFRGFSKGTQNLSILTIPDIATAIQSAVNMAYKAVMRPTEGTILTVAREISEFAQKNYMSFLDIEKFVEELLHQGEKSLENTPNLLPVLKQAGVVDSGGKGLLCILEGMLKALKGTPVEIKNEQKIEQPQELVKTIDGEIEFGYCTEFLIKTDKENVEKHEKMLIDKLSKLGDSLIVVGDESVLKVHVHTNEPWNAMKIASACGEFSKIKIDNMRLQHSELFQKEELEKQQAQQQPQYSMEKTDYILIAVSSGEGMSNILKDLGVTYIIEGGQTMNPSTQDFLQVINNTNADNYILLPNNKNIILAASQAKEISNKNIAVLESRTIPEAISALMNFSPCATLEENIEEMKDALDSVVTAQITFAVRDTELDGKKIKKDDIIGIVNGEIAATEKNVEKAALTVAHKIIKEDTELLSIYYGSQISEKDAQALGKKIQKQYPACDVEVFFGGQPLYYYIISAE